MSEQKPDIKRKINNVKGWLESAENSFQDNQELKGQLNLMLAQAEMQTLSKANGKWYKKYKVYIVLGIIILVFATGIIYNLFIERKNATITIRNNNVSTPINDLPVESHKTINEVPEKKSTEISNSLPHSLQPAVGTSTERAVTESEMRSLVRQAQQSLHGELKR